MGPAHIIEQVPWPNPHVWERVAPMIERSVRRTDHETLLDVVDELNAGRAHLWAISGGAAALVTRFVETRDGLALEYWHLAGSRAREWFGSMTAAIEEAARAVGAVKAIAGCRMGWIKHAKDYRAVAVKLEKRL